MHFLFFVRGVYSQVEIFKTLAQSQFWKWERTNLKTGKKQIDLVQGALRPSVFGAYEYVFPEECLAEVISVFGITKGDCDILKLKIIGKLFGCEKISDEIFKQAAKIPNTISINNSMRGLSNLCVDGVGLRPIGIKKDRRGEMYGYNQEAL